MGAADLCSIELLWQILSESVRLLSLVLDVELGQFVRVRLEELAWHVLLLIVVVLVSILTLQAAGIRHLVLLVANGGLERVEVLGKDRVVAGGGILGSLTSTTSYILFRDNMTRGLVGEWGVIRAGRVHILRQELVLVSGLREVGNTLVLMLWIIVKIFLLTILR